ncbi:MAG: 6-carboxytetrahydropterin synthase [Calditrichaceae bacterium]|nr:6-carboxytetrahydropterin synthase [Calditrichaceae bacterium]
MAITVSLTRIYSFSAAHRLNSETLDERKNIEVYDKCNNPQGHGHNYKIELTVTGRPDPDTGMIISRTLLDKKVKSLLHKLNYKHLDNEVSYFKDKISSGENIVQYLWDQLDTHIGGKMLYHLKLWETNNNSFELGR